MIEVKDWKLENFRAMDRLTATLQGDGREVRKSNSLEQAKQYAYGVCRLLESDPALVGEPGSSFRGKLVFPRSYRVVLANISRKAFAGTDLVRAMERLHMTHHARSVFVDRLRAALGAGSAARPIIG